MSNQIGVTRTYRGMVRRIKNQTLRINKIKELKRRRQLTSSKIG
jgi:hypothetical protein